MKIYGPELHPAVEFKFMNTLTSMSASTFSALTEEGLFVSRTFYDLCALPDNTPVMAHWHGARRTDAFVGTLGEFKQMAKDQGIKAYLNGQYV